MARKLEKRSERRAAANGEVRKVAARKSNEYEESVSKLKKDSWKWLAFFISILLIWFIIQFNG